MYLKEFNNNQKPALNSRKEAQYRIHSSTMSWPVERLSSCVGIAGVSLTGREKMAQIYKTVTKFKANDDCT
jgi:hypothetical protein